MATPKSSSDREAKDSRASIYERADAQASSSRGEGRVFKAATGLVTGAAAGFLFSELGVPRILNLDRVETFVPLMLIGAGVALTRLRRLIVWLTVAAIALVCVVSYTDVARVAVQRSIRTDPFPSAAAAIVVLSAGLTSDGMLSSQGVDRLLKGIELYQKGIAPIIVLTQERARGGRGYVTSTNDQNRLLALGGVVNVFSTGQVGSTREEALSVGELARRHSWGRILLVTSPLHSRRACAAFEKAGLTVSCIPSDSRDIAVRNLTGPDNRLRAFSMWIYELAGTLRYRQAGWI